MLKGRIPYKTHFTLDIKIRLSKILNIIWVTPTQNDASPDINEVTLSQILIAESDKIYLRKPIDYDSKVNLARVDGDLRAHLFEIIRKSNSQLQHFRALINTMLDVSNQRLFFPLCLLPLTEATECETLLEPYYKHLKLLV